MVEGCVLPHPPHAWDPIILFHHIHRCSVLSSCPCFGVSSSLRGSSISLKHFQAYFNVRISWKYYFWIRAQTSATAFLRTRSDINSESSVFLVSRGVSSCEELDLSHSCDIWVMWLSFSHASGHRDIARKRMVLHISQVATVVSLEMGVQTWILFSCWSVSSAMKSP